MQKKEFDKITTSVEQLASVSSVSERRPTMNAHEFIDYKLEFDLNNPYTATEEEIIGMLDGGGGVADNEPIKVEITQISDVVVDRVGFKEAESALVTLKP